jgi:hypothetical protein
MHLNFLFLYISILYTCKDGGILLPIQVTSSFRIDCAYSQFSPFSVNVVIFINLTPYWECTFVKEDLSVFLIDVPVSMQRVPPDIEFILSFEPII